MTLETRIRSNNNQGNGGGAGTGTSNIVYAPTGGAYVSWVADATLTADKVLTASNNITITTDNNAIYISANTGASGASIIYAPTGGPYITFIADSTLSNEKILTASNNITITTSATAVFITALTPTVVAQSGGTIYAPTGGSYVSYLADTDLSAEKVLTASNNIQITTGATQVYITALTPTVVAQSGGTVYTSTGSFFLLSQTDGSLTNSKVISASNNILVTTNSTTMFITALTPTLIAQSAGTVYTSTGSYFLLSQTDGSLPNSKVIIGSTNITITTDSTRMYISATTGSAGASIVYAPTGGPYITFATDGTLSAEHVLTASNNITITTSATAVFITALTPTVTAQSGGTVYTSTGSFFVLSQTDGTLPNSKTMSASNNMLITTDSTRVFFTALTATAITYAPTGGNYIAFLADASLSNEKVLTASNNITITTNSTTVFLSANSQSIAGKVDTSTTITVLYPLTGGGTLETNRTIRVDTAFLITSARTLTAGSGLTGGGDLGADRTFSVNTNVRDKYLSFFFAGNIGTSMLAENAYIYIPFNMELRDVRLAVSSSASGANIIINPKLYNGTVQASTNLFLSANRPMIVTNNAVGSGNTFNVTSVHAGSWLGVDIDQVGSTIAGSNLTVTFVMRAS